MSASWARGGAAPSAAARSSAASSSLLRGGSAKSAALQHVALFPMALISLSLAPSVSKRPTCSFSRCATQGAATSAWLLPGGMCSCGVGGAARGAGPPTPGKAMRRLARSPCSCAAKQQVGVAPPALPRTDARGGPAALRTTDAVLQRKLQSVEWPWRLVELSNKPTM